MSSIVATRIVSGRARCRRSAHRMTNAPATNAQATGTGANRCALIALPNSEAESSGRNERDEQVEREALRAGVGEDAPQHRDEPRAELPAHGEDRAGLDHDLEGLRLLAGVAQQRAGHDQVAGGRDGQELGEAFDNAEQGRRDERGLVQDGAGKKKAGKRIPAREL